MPQFLSDPNDGIGIDDRNTGSANLEAQVDDQNTGSTEYVPLFDFSGIVTVMPRGQVVPDPPDEEGMDVPLSDGMDNSI